MMGVLATGGVFEGTAVLFAAEGTALVETWLQMQTRQCESAHDTRGDQFGRIRQLNTNLDFNVK